MEWRHTKLGRWIWVKFWYRIDWYIGERKLHYWIKYAQKHNMFLTITQDYLNRMDEGLEKRKRPSVIFKSYHKW